MTKKTTQRGEFTVGLPFFCMSRDCNRPPRPYGAFVLTRKGSEALSPCEIHTSVLTEFIDALAAAEREQKEKSNES